MNEKRFVALFDCHYGKEYVPTKGKLVLRPTQNNKAIHAVKKFMEDFKPDIVILGGDQLNCGPISHWHHGKPRLTEGLRLKEEMDNLNTDLLLPIDCLKPKIKVWMDGNHEAWIQELLNTTPGLEGLVAPKDYLNLQKRGYTLRSQGEIYSLGKLHFVHGDVALKNGGGVNPARTLVQAYRRNIRAGHIHTWSAAIDETPVDRQDYHSGVIVPSLSTRQPAYIKWNPTKFMNGFLYGYLWPDELFTDYVVVINKGRFICNGKVYDGNKE